MTNSDNRQQIKEQLLARQKRLQTFKAVDVPVFMDVDKYTGTDIAGRLQVVLDDYALTIESWIQEIDRIDEK